MEQLVEARYRRLVGDKYGDDADSLFHQASLRIGSSSLKLLDSGLPAPQIKTRIIDPAAHV
jgi:hypothetical protein